MKRSRVGKTLVATQRQHLIAAVTQKWQSGD